MERWCETDLKKEKKRAERTGSHKGWDRKRVKSERRWARERERKKKVKPSSIQIEPSVAERRGERRWGWLRRHTGNWSTGERCEGEEREGELKEWRGEKRRRKAVQCRALNREEPLCSACRLPRVEIYQRNTHTCTHEQTNTLLEENCIRLLTSAHTHHICHKAAWRSNFSSSLPILFIFTGLCITLLSLITKSSYGLL